MFDFIGDYIGWVTQDGWTIGGIFLLGLSAAGALLLVLALIAGLVALIGVLAPPYGQARAAAKAEWRESRDPRS